MLIGCVGCLGGQGQLLACRRELVLGVHRVVLHVVVVLVLRGDDGFVGLGNEFLRGRDVGMHRSADGDRRRSLRDG